MIELLKLCGFEEQDIKTELPRIEKTFKKLGITAEDIERGKQRLTRYYDVELKGIRKALRLCVRELVNSVRAREEGKTKIIFGLMMPAFNTIGTAIVSKSKEVYTIDQSFSLQVVVGSIFDKLVPVLEAAEQRWLKAGVVAHCGNVKLVLGPIALGLVPRPDLTITAGFMCETAPKTGDLLHEIYGIPACSCDTCQDRGINEGPDAMKRSIDLAVKSLRRVVKRVEEVVGFEITDALLLEVLDAKDRLGKSMRKLRELIQSSDPLPLSTTHDAILMAMGSSPKIEYIPEVIDAVDTLYKELQERVNKGEGVIEKGAPRILATLPPNLADPRLEHLIGELGIAKVASESGIMLPVVEKSRDPYMMMLLPLQEGIAVSPSQRIPLIIEECKRLKVDGVLVRYHVGCRTVTGDAIIIKEAVEKELGIPALLLEWESFDPRVYNHEEYKRRLEVFKTMMTKRSS